MNFYKSFGFSFSRFLSNFSSIRKPSSKCFSTSASNKFFEIDYINELLISSPTDSTDLNYILQVFENNQVKVTRTEKCLFNENSNPQKPLFQISFEAKKEDPLVQKTVSELKGKFQTVEFNREIIEVPWFPRNMKELHLLELRQLEYKDPKFNLDHLQFTDEKYVKRRKELSKITYSHIPGEPIPLVKYLPHEVETWTSIYDKMSNIHQQIFTEVYNKNIKKFEKACGVSRNQIPQLRDLDQYLASETNFRIIPVSGLLSQRDFFYALAHRVFCCTQYIRHESDPYFSPDPDMVHEMIGHIPMFADPIYAQMVQEFGLLSLGASDEEIRLLGALFWFTFEMGSVKEKNEIKAYGGAIASSLEECQNHININKKSGFKKLNPTTEFLKSFYPVKRLQEVFYYTESLDQAHEMVIELGNKLEKPMKCSYDQATKSIKIDRKIKTVETKETSKMY